MNTNVQIDEIIAALETYDGEYKRDYVEAALARRDEIIPELIAILEKVTANPEYYLYEVEDYFGPFYAIFLLGHFKAVEGHKAIIEFVSLPDEIPDSFLGDLITEDLGAILFETCGGSLDKIKGLVLNREADEYCRSAAMRALGYAAAEGMVSRDEVLSFLGPLFTGNEAERSSDFWDMLAFTIYDLNPKGMMDVIDFAYERRLISPMSISRKEFEKRMEKSIEASLADLRAEFERYTPDNIHKRMDWWACFN
jgi:hypothetical protein